MASPFVMLPLAANTDSRLSLRQLKTLTAICSFRKSADDFCVEAGRDEIASRCGFNASIVSTATTELQRLGWLVKEGAGGRGIKTTYTITIPVTVPDSGTVTESETVLQSGTVSEYATVPDSVSKTVPDSGTVTESETVLQSGTVSEYATVPDSVSKTVPDSGTPLYTKKVNTDGRFSKPKVVEPEGFGECWSAYPKREGGNSRADALKAYRGRLKAGASPANLLAGVKRYAAYCASKGIVGTTYVKQAVTFFGPGDHWQESWAVPSAIPAHDQKPKAGDTRARHGITETFNEVAGWVPA